MKVYRVAILGCRGRGTAAARAYFQHPRTDLVALCDLLPERLQTLGDELGVAARYSDYNEMISKEAPDIVVIPTGTEFHYDLSMGVLDRGVNIDVEKPMCTTLAEADEVVARAQERGVQIAVHHQGRAGGAMRALKKAVSEGRIGEVRYLQGSGKGYYAGYGLMNIGTHMLNNMIGIAGHCRSVTASVLTGGQRITPEDVIPAAGGMGYVAGERMTATLEFDHNASGVLLQHRFPKVDSTAYCLEVFGTEGRLFWRTGGASFLPVPHDEPGNPDCQWEPLELVLPASYDPSGPASEADYGYTDDYVEALDQGRQHECSGLEGRHVLEIMMGILESGAYGRRVDLPQADRSHPLLRWREEAGLGLPDPMPRVYGEWLEAEDLRLSRRAKA